MAGLVPFGREFSGAILGFSDYDGPAGSRFFAETTEFLKQAQQGEVDINLLKAANRVAGIFFHYPALQLERTILGTMELLDDKKRDVNPLAPLVGPSR